MFATALLAVTTLLAGNHTFDLAFGGLQRSYVVHIPPGVPKSAPVVLNLHGGGSNAAQQQTFSGMDAVADREHFIVVYPNGTGSERMRVWNAGTCCGAAAVKQIDDVGFIRAVIDDLSKRIPIDRKRVYATGMSNGAMMSYRIAAEAPDLVAAIAPVSGSMVLTTFHSTRPVPVMHFHSVDDPRALYSGGLGPPFPGTSLRTLHPPVEEQLAKWIAIDGCQTTPSIANSLRGKPGTADDGNTATKLVYAPCASGANVVLWKLSGSGHVWPGRDTPAPRLLGHATHLIDANEEIWGFFQQVGAHR